MKLSCFSLKQLQLHMSFQNNRVFDNINTTCSEQFHILSIKRNIGMAHIKFYLLTFTIAKII